MTHAPPANNEPGKLVTSLVPAWNKLTWFEVTEASHHQVVDVVVVVVVVFVLLLCCFCVVLCC